MSNTTTTCNGHRNGLGEITYCGGNTVDVSTPITFTDANGLQVTGRVFERFPESGNPAAVVTDDGVVRSVPGHARIFPAPRYVIREHVTASAQGKFYILDRSSLAVVDSMLTYDQAATAYCARMGLTRSEFGCRGHLGTDETCGNCA